MISDKAIGHVSGIITCAIIGGVVYGFLAFYNTPHYDAFCDAISVLMGVITLALMIRFWKISLIILGIIALIASIAYLISEPIYAIIALLAIILSTLLKLNKSIQDTEKLN